MYTAPKMTLDLGEPPPPPDDKAKPKTPPKAEASVEKTSVYPFEQYFTAPYGLAVRDFLRGTPTHHGNRWTNTLGTQRDESNSATW